MDDLSLNKGDLEFILTSLAYTKSKFEDTEYPTYELKKSQLDYVDTVVKKIRILRDKLAKL